ncbi:MAG: pyrroline-5-carboxylate reductase [Eubacterium sp.]|nr:pyrroline-5-carboxylate reductase [Eubacterium sp.]
MKIGCIGCGNMARALIGGILKKELVGPEDILAADILPQALETAQAEYGIRVTKDNREAAGEAECLILAVKPQFLEEAIRSIRDAVKKDTLIISLAPGKTLAWLEEQFGFPAALVRTMPNTPAMAGEGMAALCAGTAVTEEQKRTAESIFSSVGKASFVTENLMDTVTGVSGSSPAYVFLFIEALADAAVLGGMPRQQAYEFAAQSVLGSAKLMLESGRHPAELKDMVCSPGGTTIEAVRVLEEKGFRGAVIDAVQACIEKSKGM